MRVCLFLTAMVAPCYMAAQWQSVAGGTVAGTPYDLLYDANTARLYAMGGMRYMVYGNLQVNGTAYYEEGTWHTMRSGVTHPWNGLIPPVKTICPYGEALIVAGEFKRMDSIPNTSYVARWENEEWHSMGVDTSEQGLGNYVRLQVWQDKLHLLGAFDWNMNGPIRSWAIWDGNTWTAGDTLGLLTDGLASSLAEFQGALYIGGNFQADGLPNDLARWEVDHWAEVGGGINGDPWVNEMVVFQNKLYVAGEFAASWGNAANGLMAWDGTQWTNPFPQISFFAQCRNVEVANGKLWFLGPFNAQGLPGEYHFGVFDGGSLCVFGGNNVWDAARLCVSPDTVYAYVFLQTGPDLNNIAQWPINAPSDTCYSIVEGVDDHTLSTRALLFPNPAHDEVRIQWSASSQLRSLAVYDVCGREMMRTSAFNPTNPRLSVGHLPAGGYTLKGFGPSGLVLFHGHFVRAD